MKPTEKRRCEAEARNARWAGFGPDVQRTVLRQLITQGQIPGACKKQLSRLDKLVANG